MISLHAHFDSSLKFNLYLCLYLSFVPSGARMFRVTYFAPVFVSTTLIWINFLVQFSKSPE